MGQPLPPHTTKDLAQAAQLAVIQGRAEAVPELIQRSGKRPSLLQINRLLAYSTSPSQKRILKDAFSENAIQTLTAKPKGVRLARALATLSRVDLPGGGGTRGLRKEIRKGASKKELASHATAAINAIRAFAAKVK
jgi:hypothetical protein